MATAHCFSIFGFGFMFFVYRIDVCVLGCRGIVGLIGGGGTALRKSIADLLALCI
jgi:hypothetical protein